MFADEQRVVGSQTKTEARNLLAAPLVESQPNPSMNVVEVNQTYRLGRTMVDVIRNVLPFCNGMESIRPHASDTLFLPVLLERSKNWHYASEPGQPREVVRDDYFFAHALALVA